MAGTKDIKDFTKYPSLSDNDYLLGTKTDLGGTDAGITVGNFKKQVARDAAPSINENGYWVVNGISTGEKARGETPVLNSGTITTGEEGTEASSEVIPDGQTPEGSPKYKLNLTLPRGSAGKAGKTAIFGIGNVSDGDKASATLTTDGEDGSGNPRYKLNLVLPVGKTGEKGKTPKFEAGSVSTLEPGQPASAEISFKEYDTEGSPIYVISLSIPKGDTGSPGKTPVLKSVNAKSGDTPFGSFVTDGTDESGNPKYILNLTLPAGKDGQPAIFEQGTTTTLEPTEPALVEVVENGITPEGNPKYILNFSIPRGQVGKPGIGSGNVSVDGTGLVTGKKYLFVPESDGSTAGTFVEYVAPEAYDDTPLKKEIADNLAAAKTYTNEQIAGIVQFDIKAVPVLPDAGVKGTIYLVPKTGSGNDVHNEYIWIESKSDYELIGSTDIDLSDYYTKDEADKRYVLKEAGKRLMTDEEGEKLKRIHFIPTLNHEPGENDLTFTDSEGEHSFLIGDQARVVDTGKGGYVFWQLYDVVENKATWKKTGAGGNVMELTERLIVSLQTNQEYIQDPVLMGLVVHVKYADHDLELEYQGVPMSIDIPMSVVYTIEYPLLDGYNTPPRETHLALSGNERYSIGKYETTALNIELESNQGEDPALNGVGVMIEYDGKIKNLTWTNGESMIIKIPTGIECTVTAASLPGYKSPPAKVIIPSGVTVNETFTYLTELVNVRLNAENGVSCSGQKVTIGGTEYTYESPVLVKIPYDTDYSVSVNSKAGFELPDPLYFSAGQRERDITVTYMAIKRGVFILDTSEKLIRKADWDTSNNSRAVGVAVLSDNCKFVISKKTINKKWCATSVLVTGIVTTTNSVEAIKDYKGKENTDKIYSQLGNSNAIAVDYCKNTVGLFPDNRPGYLGSAGEWEEAVNNFNEVKECMTLIGGEAFQSSSYPLWTSTQYSDKMVWTTYQNGSLTQSLKQNANYIRALASVDYPF